MTQLMLGCLRGAGVTAEEHSMAPLGNLTICLTRRTQTQGHCQSRVRQAGTKFWRNFKLWAVGLKEVLVTWRGTLEGGLSGDENPGPAPPRRVRRLGWSRLIWTEDAEEESEASRTPRMQHAECDRQAEEGGSRDVVGLPPTREAEFPGAHGGD